MALARGAQPGNNNGQKTRIWSDAIRKAVLSGKKLDSLANAIINAALSGDVAALREIGDRLEGKVVQQIANAPQEQFVIRIDGIDDNL